MNMKKKIQLNISPCQSTHHDLRRFELLTPVVQRVDKYPIQWINQYPADKKKWQQNKLWAEDPLQSKTKTSPLENFEKFESAKN